MKDFDVVMFVHESRRSTEEARLLARSCVLNEQGRHVWLLAPPVGFCIPLNIEV
jgi:hypothetical protein